MRHLKVLTPTDIEQFIEEGYVVLREAFPASVAKAVRETLWPKLGVSPDDPSQWKKRVIHIQEGFLGEPFTGALTQRVWDGYDDVVGEGRYNNLQPALGWWPVAFPGFDAPPWTPPQTGWHVDGIHFHHHVYSKTQGLLPIYLFSDIGPGDGGTAVDVGSHLRTAKILADAEPAGLSPQELTAKVNATPPVKPVEMTGRAGDVVLLHPFMLHARSANTGKSVRFICNPCLDLKEDMNLQRADSADYSPVELAIVKGMKGS